MGKVQLLSTDFDGTLVGHLSDGQCCAELSEALEAFKRSGGMWAINTGRSLAHTLEGIERFDSPIEPDYLVTSERHIYRRNLFGEWIDFGDWNAVSRQRHHDLFHDSNSLLSRVVELAGDHPDVTLIEETGYLVGLVTTDERVMAEVSAILGVLRGEYPDFACQRNMTYLRFCHSAYHKGSALGELARLLDIPKSVVLAVGDHYNDLPMLNGEHASLTACPANAIQPVVTQILELGGYYAGEPFGAGVAEAINYFHENGNDFA